MSGQLRRLQIYNSCRSGWLPPTLVVSLRLFTPCIRPSYSCMHRRHRNIVISYMVWLTATRTAKLLPHLWYRPQDIIHVPAFIAFGYYFAVMKVYALLTLHEVRVQPCSSLFSRSLQASGSLSHRTVPLCRLVGELARVSVTPLLPPLQPTTNRTRRTTPTTRRRTRHNRTTEDDTVIFRHRWGRCMRWHR